jgi:uncharacterized protein
MNSPFSYESFPNINEFFGRTKELEKLSIIVKYSNNLQIHSKRRMGKSSLIKTFFKQNSDN